MQEGYLVNLGRREHEAVERLVSLPVIGENFFLSLGLAPQFSWYLFRVRANRLVASIAGDVDLLAGRLEWSDTSRFQTAVGEEARAYPEAHPSWREVFAAWRLACDGGIKWPPSVHHLVAVEAKCAYLTPDAPEISERTLRSKKQSPGKVRRVRQQVDQLASMGFDRVALLDIIASPPGYGLDGQAWLVGSLIASRTLDAMSTILEQRLPSGSLVGHYVWSAAAVAGADERWQGGGAVIERRPAAQNQLLSNDATVKGRRKEMGLSLERILRTMPRALGFPVILVDCERCGTIHSGARSC